MKYSGVLRIVYIGDSWGFNEETFPIVRELLNSIEDCQWNFLNPSSFYAYFKANDDGRKQANEIVEAIRKLRENDERFSETKVGTSEGEVIGEFNDNGSLKEDSHPMGQPMTAAMTSAI